MIKKHPEIAVKYDCKQCKEWCNTQYDLSRHINTHHAKKQTKVPNMVLDCFMCGKVKADQDKLNKHVNGHFDQNPQDKVDNNITMCTNGITCRFLRQNRC